MTRLTTCENIFELDILREYLSENTKKYPLIQAEYAAEEYIKKLRELQTI
jgi:hypothetical protein